METTERELVADSGADGSLGRDFASRLTGPWTAALVAVLAVLFSGALIGVVGQADHVPSPLDALPRGSQSAQAAELAQQLPDADASTAVVLFSRDGEALSEQDLAVAEQRLADVPGAQEAQLVPSEDGTAALAVITVEGVDATEVADQVTAIRATVKADLPEGLQAQVTGPAAVQADLAAVFDGADLRLLLVTAAVVAVLLVVTYRSPVLWVIPLTVVGLADQVAAVAATHTLAAFDLAWDESTIGILSVLVFGAGTDYSLLLISRYRDELRTHADRRAAMARALRRTAEAVLSSATTVVLGLLTLLLSLFPTTRGLGLACAVGVVVATFFALVVLPAALVCFGRWVFWPRVPREGQAALADARSGWRRVADAVAARPVAYAAATVALLAITALGATGITTGLSDADQFLDTPEAISAGERLAESFPAGTSDPTRIVTTADVDEVSQAATAVDGVVSVRPGATADGVSEVNVVLAAPAGSAEAADTVEALRAALEDLPQTYVTGSEAVAADVAAANARDRWVIMPLILLLVLVALGLLLRALVAPVVLVATVVATYVSALGISWWLFTHVFGFDRLDDGVPLTAFVFLVALGVDYNIFLVTRAREEARDHGVHEGMLRALASTGGVITSAGILLAAVFAVLGVLPLVVLAQLGVVICVGVLLDTLVVRTVLVPALALLLGERFWWPGTPTGAVPAQPAASTARAAR